jgi:hypothetical protein
MPSLHARYGTLRWRQVPAQKGFALVHLSLLDVTPRSVALRCIDDSVH